MTAKYLVDDTNSDNGLFLEADFVGQHNSHWLFGGQPGDEDRFR